MSNACTSSVDFMFINWYLTLSFMLLLRSFQQLMVFHLQNASLKVRVSGQNQLSGFLTPTWLLLHQPKAIHTYRRPTSTVLALRQLAFNLFNARIMPAEAQYKAYQSTCCYVYLMGNFSVAKCLTFRVLKNTVLNHKIEPLPSTTLAFYKTGGWIGTDIIITAALSIKIDNPTFFFIFTLSFKFQ